MWSLYTQKGWFFRKKKDQIQERELGKGVLWHSETSLLQHSDNDLRLISQEEVEKNLDLNWFYASEL